MSCHRTNQNFIFRSHESEVITMSNIIEIKNITKEFKVLKRREGLKGSLKDLFSRDYKIVRAVDNISMNIQQGEIVGYLGPNGAGKSTTIKMMTGILEPTSGEILVGGNVPYHNRTKNAQKIGVVFGQRSQLWWALPLIESFKILKDIYGVSNEDYDNMIALQNAAAATCFWIQNSFYVLDLVTRFKDYAKYPITIFSPVFRFIFTFVMPIAFIVYYPSIVILRPDEIPLLSWLSPLIGVIFFWISYKFWMHGALKYSGTGS